MVVRYTNTFKDSLAFATVQNLSSIPLLVFVLALSAGFAWSSTPDDVQGFRAVAVFSLMTLLMFCVLLAFQLLFNAYWFALNRDRNFLTEHNVEITDSGFIVSTEFTRLEIKWRGVFRVRGYFNRLFIFDGPAKAHCIPARAFLDRLEFKKFTSNVLESWRHAK